MHVQGTGNVLISYSLRLLNTVQLVIFVGVLIFTGLPCVLVPWNFLPTKCETLHPVHGWHAHILRPRQWKKPVYCTKE